MSGRFQDKKVVIVGGSSGIGLELAGAFLREGAWVAIAGRDAKKLELASQGLQNIISGNSFGIAMDVTSYPSVEKGVKKILKKMSFVDIVICSAGTHLKTLARDMSAEQWKHILDTNLTGTYHVDILFGRQMLEQGKGCIINIASLASRVALSLTCAYNVSKSGVEMLTKSLASEWALQGVRVNAILPVVFKTALNAKALEDGERVRNILNHTPMKRFGKLSEIVSSAFFLASDESSFVTGTSVVVDGGFLAYAGF